MTRPKVDPDKRQRTAQACDSCKRRKQKVSDAMFSSLAYCPSMKLFQTQDWSHDLRHRFAFGPPNLYCLAISYFFCRALVLVEAQYDVQCDV
jgi:hypothetical protein